MPMIGCNKHRHVRKAALWAVAAMGCISAFAAQAAVVDSGPVSLSVPANVIGLYLNLVTGANGNASVPGWDVNLFQGSGNLAFFTSSSTSNNNQVVGSGTTITALAPGATIGPASTFAPAGIVNTTGTAFRQTGTTYAGFRFTNEAGGANTLHYGYIEITTTATTGFPAIVTRYVFESTPNTAITIGGGATAPQFAYNPAAGTTVSATGGSFIGSTGTLTITPSVGTAGSGTGAAATTTLTCTQPTAPFAGFGQTVTAAGTGAITGGPLAGTCTLGASAVTQPLVCNENRGGSNNERTWTLSCPAGTAAVVQSVDTLGNLAKLLMLLAVLGVGLIAVRRH